MELWIFERFRCEAVNLLASLEIMQAKIAAPITTAKR